jgi:ABC-type transport system involved in multi-copper enzyme maturation permease subunit
MVRTARRTRYFLMRGLYALGMVVLLFLMYQSIIVKWASRGAPSHTRMAQFAEGFFNAFMGVQFVMVLFLTPAYVAGAVAEEKERRTLEFLLATDLRNREIVLSKLLSRLANLVLFLLAGLPVLSLMQLFGGVDPGLLWAGFAATALLVLSIASVSILVSVYTRRARDAIIRTGMLVIGYYLLSFLTTWLYFYLTMRVMFSPPGTYDLDVVEQVKSGLNAFNAGSVIFGIARLMEHVTRTGNMGGLLLDVLRNFAIFHGTLAVVCLTLAVWRLRPVFIKQSYGTPLPTGKGRHKVRRRPPVKDHPILWKELHAERGSRFTRGGVVMYIVSILIFLSPLAFMVYHHFFDDRGGQARTMEQLQRDFADSMNAYLRIVGTAVSCFLLLGVAIRAAGSVGSERDRQTMDSLLSSPLTNQDILAGKWFGSLAGARPLFFFLAFLWVLGVVTGGLHVMAVPLLIVTLAIYSALMASLGVAFSAGSKTTLRAMMWTVGLAVLIGGGHWFCCGLPVMAVTSGSDALAKFLFGLTPPAVMAFAAFTEDNLRNMPREAGEFLFYGGLGLLVSVFAAILLYAVAHERFRVTTGRAMPRGTS